MSASMIVTIITLAFLAITFGVLKWVPRFKYRKLGILAGTTAVVSIITDIFGGIFPRWDVNSTCYKFFGCNTGFFGYDIVEYFFFGLAAVCVIFWISKKFPWVSFYADKKWKTVLFTFSFVALLVYLWELLKALWDFLRASLFHMTLFSWKFHINLLAQPSNLNTMGNLFFCLVGAVTAFCAVWFVDAREL